MIINSDQWKFMHLFLSTCAFRHAFLIILLLKILCLEVIIHNLSLRHLVFSVIFEVCLENDAISNISNHILSIALIDNPYHLCVTYVYRAQISKIFEKKKWINGWTRLSKIEKKISFFLLSNEHLCSFPSRANARPNP